MGWFLLNASAARWLASLTVVFLVFALLGRPAALAQVSLTTHNLISERAAASRLRASTEICVFCHTPYGADASATAPLWSRTQMAAAAYTTYNSLGTSSLDGATAPVGSVSIACLSCHDGVQALNVMINMPGSGLVSAQAGAAIIGLNPGSDHPFGIQYGGGALAQAGSALMRANDFSSAQSSVLNEQSVWWIDTPAGAAGARDKTDIQLYTRIVTQEVSASGIGPAQLVTGPVPFVECASCHDPHSATNATFLRVPNTGSVVCLACHNKM